MDSPHPTPCPPPGPSADGHSMGDEVGWGGIPDGYISILDIGYWMFSKLPCRMCGIRAAAEHHSSL